MENELSQVKSYAKVNLFLHILGKRADGYHNIYTLFCAVNLYDTITLSPSDKTYIVCSRPDIPTDEGNIIFKVDKILRDEYSLTRHFKIDLQKKIPVGAGLGGGSSNAAAYLQLVNNTAGMNLSKDEMHKILGRVGSDTCFFLYLPAATGEGRGEILTSVSLPKLHILIVNPNIFISTASIYGSKKLELTTTGLTPKISNSLDLKEIAGIMKNGLEQAVFDRYPAVKELCDAINTAGAFKAMVSGSGSSVFGIFENQEELDAAYNIIYSRYPDYTVIKTENLHH